MIPGKGKRTKGGMGEAALKQIFYSLRVSESVDHSFW